MSTHSSYASEHPGRQASVPGMTGWVGIIVFGGIMMFLLGVFHLIEGLVSLADDDFYLVGSGDLALNMPYEAWGWVQVILGVLGIAAATGIFLGMLWARVLGVLIAALSAFASMLFLASYPIWSTILIALAVLVIYALVAHGGEVRD